MTTYKVPPPPPSYIVYDEKVHGEGYCYGVCAHHAGGSGVMELHGPFKECSQANQHILYLRGEYDDYGSIYVVRIELVAP